MNNCRSGKHAPYIREWGIHITRHLEKFPSVFGLWHLKSIHIPQKGWGIMPIHKECEGSYAKFRSIVGVRHLQS